MRTTAEAFSQSYVKWWLLYLFLITCVPFTTIVVGRFANVAPAIWLYAGNTTLLGLISLVMLTKTPDVDDNDVLRSRRISLVILIATSLGAVVWSFVNSRQALPVMALNIAARGRSLRQLVALRRGPVGGQLRDQLSRTRARGRQAPRLCRSAWLWTWLAALFGPHQSALDAHGAVIRGSVAPLCGGALLSRACSAKRA
jgi:hypothetical protein